MAEPGSVFFWGPPTGGLPTVLDRADGGQVTSLRKQSLILSGEGLDFLPARPASCDALVQASCSVESTAVASGDEFTLLLASDGSVVAWGSNARGQCGLGHFAPFVPSPSPIVTLAGKRVVLVACGWEHSALVTDDGALYTFGRGTEGQLGLGRSSVKGRLLSHPAGDVPAPRFVDAFDGAFVVSASCGGRFTLVLVDSGELWAMGEGSSGQLGIGGPASLRDRPCAVDCSVPFAQVEAGWAHALGVSREGELFAWGDNSKGQLGVGDCRARYRPTMVTLASGDPLVVSSMSAGLFHSAAVDTHGQLFSWGSTALGRLGHSTLVGPSASVLAHTESKIDDLQLEELSVAPPSAWDPPTEEVALPPRVLERGATSSLAVHALAAQLPSLDRPPPGSREPSRRGRRPAQTLRATQQAGVPRDELGMGAIPGAMGKILSPFQRFRERMSREDGGRGGADPPPSHLVAQNLNVSALVRVPELDATLSSTLQAPTDALAEAEAAAGLIASLQRPRSPPAESIDLTASAVLLSLSGPSSPSLRAKATREAVALESSMKRIPLSRDASGVVPSPQLVDFPELHGRIVTHVACSTGGTCVFAPALVKQVFPDVSFNSTGAWVSILGPGIGSLVAASERRRARADKALRDGRLGCAMEHLEFPSGPATHKRNRRLEDPDGAEGIGARLFGVAARFTRPGSVPVEALTSEFHDVDPDEAAAFDPAQDALVAKSEPCVQFAPVFAVAADSSFVTEAQRFALAEQQGPRIGMPPDVIVCRCPPFPDTCDVVVELVVLDDSVLPWAPAWASDDPPLPTADEVSFASPRWTLLRGVAQAAICERPLLTQCSQPAMVLAAGGAVSFSGSHLLDLFVKDPLGREQAEAFVQQVADTLALREQLEVQHASLSASMGFREDVPLGSASVEESAEDSPLDTPLFLSVDIGSADEPASTLMRFRLVSDSRELFLTQPCACWWSAVIDERTALADVEDLATVQSSASVLSVGHASASVLSGGGGVAAHSNADGPRVASLQDIAPTLHCVVPVVPADVVPKGASGLRLIPELSPNGRDWMAFPAASMTGLNPSIGSIVPPGVVALSRSECTLDIQGEGFVPGSSGILARVGDSTLVPLQAVSPVLLQSAAPLYDLLDTLVPAGGATELPVAVSFDNGNRFLPIPSSSLTVVDASVRIDSPCVIGRAGATCSVELGDWASAARFSGEELLLQVRARLGGAEAVLPLGETLVIPPLADFCEGGLEFPLTLELSVSVDGGHSWGSIGRDPCEPVTIPVLNDEAISIKSVGPKKIAPGGSLEVTLAGLAESKLPSREVLQPLLAVSTSPSPSFTGADDSGVCLAEVAFADGDGATLLATLPSLADGLVPGDQHVSASLDGGRTWLAAAACKIAKK
jgi:hypothetical protein